MFSARTGQGRKAEGRAFPGRRLLFVGRGRTGKRGPVARHASIYLFGEGVPETQARKTLSHGGRERMFRCLAAIFGF